MGIIKTRKLEQQLINEIKELAGVNQFDLGDSKIITNILKGYNSGSPMPELFIFFPKLEKYPNLVACWDKLMEKYKNLGLFPKWDPTESRRNFLEGFLDDINLGEEVVDEPHVEFDDEIEINYDDSRAEDEIEIDSNERNDVDDIFIDEVAAKKGKNLLKNIFLRSKTAIVGILGIIIYVNLKITMKDHMSYLI